MKQFKTPIASLLVMTIALNLLGLSVPLAAQLIFNRILPAPDSPTLPLVVGGIVLIACIEGVIRFARSFLLLNSNRIYTSFLTNKLFGCILLSDYSAGHRGAARSLEYFSRITQVSEKNSGRHLVGIAELMFLPIIIGVIFSISPQVALMISLLLVAGFFYTVSNAARLNFNTLKLNRKVERRYRFLLTILTSVHPLKALGIEEFLTRRYEAIQSSIAATSLRTAQNSGQLLTGVLTTNQIIVVVSLVYGAYAVNKGDMTLGAVSAVVLLGGRLMAPLQRAVFIFIQSRDLCEAETVLNDAFDHQPLRRAELPVEANEDQSLKVRDLHFAVEEENSIGNYANLDFDLFPGELTVLSGASETARTHLLRTMAGILEAEQGTVLLNGVSIWDYPQSQLNQLVAYVGNDGTMFKGSIRDNITRFGEIDIEQAMSIAALMDLENAIKELPAGLETKMTGSNSETIPSSLCLQLAILRSLAYRPRILLLDNVDRGLDQQGYMKLQRFLARIHGQPSIVMVSDDLNLTAGASKKHVLTPDGIRLDHSAGMRQLSTYRSLKL